MSDASASRTDRFMESALGTQHSKPLILLSGSAMIAAIAWTDVKVGVAIPLSPLYILPIILMSSTLRRWQIVVLGFICTFAAEFADAFTWNIPEGVPRDALYCFAYCAVGLYVHETFRRRRAERAHSQELEAEVETRRGVEEQLRLVVANSSIAIVTTDAEGTILDANEAAQQLWSGAHRDSATRLQGLTLDRFVPSLARVQSGREGFERLRTMMQCQGFRANRDPFLADVWFSTYSTSRGGRLTAMIIDASNETRDREQANLEQVLLSSRIAIGALSHEIRNICAAIANVQQNLLLNKPDSRQDQEFDALRQLVAALERVASAELSLVKRQPTTVTLDTFLGDLYIVVHASLRDAGIYLVWDVRPGLPSVWADPSSLMQVFLNLIRNAEAAFGRTEAPTVHIRAERDAESVCITVADNGPGVAEPEKLFRPFGGSGGVTGLGLYLSRAMLRSFHGELLYEVAPTGATFVIQLDIAEIED